MKPVGIPLCSRERKHKIPRSRRRPAFRGFYPFYVFYRIWSKLRRAGCEGGPLYLVITAHAFADDAVHELLDLAVGRMVRVYGQRRAVLQLSVQRHVVAVEALSLIHI